MIRGKIEEYKVTKNKSILEEIKASEDNKAVAFLYTVEEENYKEALTKAAKEIAVTERDEDGLFCKEGADQEQLLFDIMPVYALYETRLNKKENYIDLVQQCKNAVKKYPGSNKIFTMLAEVLEYMSEEIYEQYRTVQRLLWEQYVAVSAHMTEETVYALAKACYYKAFLLEKYEKEFEGYAEDVSCPAAYYAIRRLEQRFERN